MKFWLYKSGHDFDSQSEVASNYFCYEIAEIEASSMRQAKKFAMENISHKIVYGKNRASEYTDAGVRFITFEMLPEQLETAEKSQIWAKWKATRFNQAAAALGRLGGKVRSKAKTKAVRENGKLGGRPKKKA